MSPRPTKSVGNSRRSPKTSVSGSTYLPLATLPSSTTSQSGPDELRPEPCASRTSGRR